MVVVVRWNFADGIGVGPIAAIPRLRDQLPSISRKPKGLEMLEGEPLPDDLPCRRHFHDTVVCQDFWRNGWNLDTHRTQDERVPVGPPDDIMMKFDAIGNLTDTQTRRCGEMPHRVGVPIQLVHTLALDRKDTPRRIRKRLIKGI